MIPHSYYQKQSLYASILLPTSSIALAVPPSRILLGRLDRFICSGHSLWNERCFGDLQSRHFCTIPLCLPFTLLLSSQLLLSPWPFFHTACLQNIAHTRPDHHLNHIHHCLGNFFSNIMNIGSTGLLRTVVCSLSCT